MLRKRGEDSSIGQRSPNPHTRNQRITNRCGPLHARVLALEWLEPRALLSTGAVADSGATTLGQPVPGPDYYWTPAGTPLRVSAPGLLANDYDPDGHQLEAVNLLGNLHLDHGTLYMGEWQNDGSFEYVPFAGHNGRDTFTYYCCDPDGWMVETTVTIDVGVFNRAPFVVSPIDDVIVDQGAADTVIDLAGVFDDLDFPSGDQLTYTVAVSPPIRPIVDEVSQSSYTSIHQDLLYTHLGDNRGYNSVQHDLARDNIYNYFDSLGLTASYDVIPEIVDILNNTYTFNPPLVNVVGVKPGAVHPEDVYLVGAHYDSVHNPGADDNASGTAAVMEIARVLSEHTFESTVVFVAFDGEEDGLFGSMHYAEHHYSDHNTPGFVSNLLGVVNLDMIAYNHPGADYNVVSIYDLDDVGNVKPGLVSAFEDYAEGIIGRDDGVMGMSDHEYFDMYGFDAVLVIESGVFSNPHYHLPTDAVETPDYIDYPYATNVTRAVTGYLAQVAKPVGNVDVLAACTDGGLLTLDYDPAKYGGAVITVRATDTGGLFAEDSFAVSVNASQSDVQLQGTDLDDTITVWAGVAGSSLHQIDINGSVTTYDPAVCHTIQVDALAGNDTITIYGTAGSESVVLGEGGVSMTDSATYSINAQNVETVNVDAGAGTADQVTITGSTGSNRFYSYAGYSRISDLPCAYSYRVDGFDSLNVTVPNGGGNYAFFYDSPLDDELDASPSQVVFDRAIGTASATTTTVAGFDRVYSYATGGGNDTAALVGSAITPNYIYGYTDYSILTESRRSFYFYARGFAAVTGNSPAAEAGYAHLYDSAGSDTLTASPASATMEREGTLPDTTIAGFKRVYAYSTRGGDDTAALTGSSAGGNSFRGYPDYATLTDVGGNFYHYARGFRAVTATGSESDTLTDRAYLYDSSGDDMLHGSGNQCCLEDAAQMAYCNEVLYFDYIYARSADDDVTTDDTVDVEDADYYLLKYGSW